MRNLVERVRAARQRAAATKPPRVLPGRLGPGEPGAATRRGAAEPGAEGGDLDQPPVRLWFGPPTPNPSMGLVRFRVDLPRAAVVRLTVLDIAGRWVGEVSTEHPAGRHVVTWAAGDRVARSGVYFARLEVDGHAIGIRRLVVLR